MNEHGHFISLSQMHPFPKESNFNFHAVDAERAVLAGAAAFSARVNNGAKSRNGSRPFSPCLAPPSFISSPDFTLLDSRAM